MLPNLTYCYHCHRFQKHEDTGDAFCHNLTEEEREQRGQFSQIGQITKPDGEQSRIHYIMQFNIPYDCPYELEHMSNPPALEKRQQ